MQLVNGQREEEWARNLDQLRRLADTYEGLSLFLPENNPHRSACVFVAASAHHTLSQARVIEARIGGLDVDAPSLTVHGVGPEVAACLLFLLAGQQADAAETTKLFKTAADRPHEAELLRGLSALASGDGRQLRGFAAAGSPASTEDSDVDYLERAAAVLWAELARAVRLIGRIALGLDVSEQPDEVIAPDCPVQKEPHPSSKPQPSSAPVQAVRDPPLTTPPTMMPANELSRTWPAGRLAAEIP